MRSIIFSTNTFVWQFTSLSNSNRFLSSILKSWNTLIWFSFCFSFWNNVNILLEKLRIGIHILSLKNLVFGYKIEDKSYNSINYFLTKFQRLIKCWRLLQVTLISHGRDSRYLFGSSEDERSCQPSKILLSLLI
jgi:hypothetical protein